MLLDLLKPVMDSQAPYASVCVDATRVDRATGDELELRWADHARELEALGAPPQAVEALRRRALEPTGRGGERTRVLVASGDQVVLDLLLPGRPVKEEAAFGAVPDLMPVVRALSPLVPYAVARVDRAGADLEVVGALGDVEDEHEVNGGHDVLHKVGFGGWSHKRYQTRAQDSWERNATVVAEELDRIVRRHAPELVLLEGDSNAIAALEEHASHELKQRLVRLNTGGRAAGTSASAEEEAVRAALADHRRLRTQRLLDRLDERLRRQQEAVEGLEPVVEVLRRGQIEELLLRDDPGSTASLWVGQEPLQVGTSREDAVAAGAMEPQQVRADAALVWSLLGSSAGMTLLDGENGPDLTDGLAAVLRWSDSATPHSAVPSMPGHGEPPARSANP